MEMNALLCEVADVRVLPNGRVQVKVRHEGRLIGNEVSYRDTPEIKASAISPNEINYRIMKVDDNAQSMVKAANGYSALIGNKDTRIISSEKYGNIVVGPTSFTAHPESIRFGGVFRLNGLLTSTMPSTIITPISTFVLDVPAQDTINAIKSIMKDFQDELKDLI